MLKNQDGPSPATETRAKVARLVVLLAVGLCVCRGYGQTATSELRSEGTTSLLQSDLGVLERGEPRSDLPCTVSQIKPQLDWDFTFHTGYQVKMPVTALVGSGDELTVLFRVVPQDHPDDLVYMMQKTAVPPVEEGSKGEGTFHGIFTLGEGKYHIDWLMRNQRELICAASWNFETKLNSKDGQLREWISQAPIQPPGALFADEPPVIRTLGIDSPRVSIIVNFDPPDPTAALLDDRDIEILVGILRRIGRDPRIKTYSLIICSLQTQQIVYRLENARTIQLPALGEALRSLKLGMVDAKRLASTHGPTQFAADLIREHIRKENPDALIVLGRKTGWDARVSRDDLESFEKLSTPAFYLSYKDEQQWGMSRDPISNIVKHLHGVEYGISQPKDFFNAWSEMVSRIVRTKQLSQGSTASNARTH